MQLRSACVFICTLVMSLSISGPVFSAGSGGDSPRPVTTVDPNIAVEELTLMLYPFTKNELIIEANGWQALVKEKALVIARAEIEVRRQTRGIEKTEEIQEQAEEAKEELEEVKEKAEQARISGEIQVMKAAEESAKKAEEKVETLQQTVSEAVSDAAATAEKTTEMYERMSQETKQGLEETVAAADRASDAVKKVKAAVEEAVDRGGENRVKQDAVEVEQVSTEAQTAADDVTDKARATVEAAAENRSEALHTAQVMEDIRKTTMGKKVDLLEQINRLREERTIRVDNLRAVINELTAKTDAADSTTLALIKDYQLYIRGVSGINIDISDTTSAWAAVSGWLTSSEGGLRWAKNIAVFLGILIAAWFLSRLLSGLTRRTVSRFQLPLLLSQFLVGSVRWLTVILGVIMALMSLEFSIAPILAVVGAAGFIIAFALQDSLSNVANGLMILFFRPFDIGDVVEAGGVSGKVTALNLVATTIRTFDNKKMIVPNNSIIGNVITNSTSVSKRRVDLEFRVRYDADVDQTVSILSDIVAGHPKVLQNPAPTIKVSALTDSAVHFICRPWTGSGDYWAVYWDVTEAVKKRFDAEGIGVPYPQQEVHVFLQNREEGAATVGTGEDSSTPDS